MLTILKFSPKPLSYCVSRIHINEYNIEMIIFESLLTTFVANSIYRGSWEVAIISSIYTTITSSTYSVTHSVELLTFGLFLFLSRIQGFSVYGERVLLRRGLGRADGRQVPDRDRHLRLVGGQLSNLVKGERVAAGKRMSWTGSIKQIRIVKFRFNCCIWHCEIHVTNQYGPWFGQWYDGKMPPVNKKNIQQKVSHNNLMLTNFHTPVCLVISSVNTLCYH